MTRPLALIVEDERDISIIFARALEAAGFKTEIARAGDVAVEWLATRTPAVVILDLNLPRVPGAEILRRIRADARLASTKVIVATAYPNLDEELQNQADCVLCKPVSFAQLRDLAARFGAISLPSGSIQTDAAQRT